MASTFLAVAAPAQALAPLSIADQVGRTEIGAQTLPAHNDSDTVDTDADTIVDTDPTVDTDIAGTDTDTASAVAALDLPVAPLPPAAVSLAQLVTQHSSTQTASPDLECLAAAVYFEAKGEPLSGQLAVARVIRNRSKLSRFASTYCGVIRQAGQFSFVRGGGFPPIVRSGANWRTAVAIATVAHDDLWTAPAADALYFHARRVAPSWRLVRVASVGNHVFYR